MTLGGFQDIKGQCRMEAKADVEAESKQRRLECVASFVVGGCRGVL